ncbi:hypothetical protein [Pseudonocardia thermophila]|uniref:hypothetical protein n=1 Tax=Pseudonocardia thermophila TaxID=1848 RepID=UPI00248DDF0E|nr:hypothetical protein [Pseudonocardia thermophila]
MERSTTRRTHDADLARYLAVHGPLDVGTAAEILGQAAATLDAAHAARVVHGRLSPGAILLNLAEGTVGVREPGGSPEPDPVFVAPEVRRGADPTAAADVYAIGALLHVCLTGQPPRADEVPAVADKALRADPAQRPPSCEAVLARLRRPIPAAEEEPLRRFPRVAAGALLVVVVLVAGMVALPDRRADEAEAAAQADLVATIGLPGCRTAPGVELGGPDGLVAAVDCAPDGPGVTTIGYRRYADAGALGAAYRSRVAVLAPVADTPCGADPPPQRAQTPWEVHGTYLGSVLCDRWSGPPTTIWTIDGLRLLGTATGPDAAELERWRVGHLMERPWISAIVGAANAAADPPFPDRAEAALLADVPDASRIDCSRLDRQFVVANVGDPDGIAAIACGPAPGARAIFWFRFADPRRFAAYRGAGPGDAADCRSEPAGFSGSARYTRPDGTAGVLGCVQEDDRAALVWTEEGRCTVGLALGGAPAALLDWWRSAAGP